MKDTVCILIPTKDRVALLGRALLSVVRQSVKPDEVIVINDGSQDSTKEFLEHFRKEHNEIPISIIHRGRNGGVNTARNQGIASATSDWILFLDDDDELLPQAVALTKDKASTIPDDFSVFYFNTIIKNDQTEFIGGFQFSDGQQYYDPTYEEVMTKFGLKGDCKPIFRRQLFSHKHYLFPESVNGFESMTIRLIARDGKKMRYYCEQSTWVDLQTTFDHLSFSAPAKNPQAYLDLHIRDFRDHLIFYLAYPPLFSQKYKEMAKLAYRAHRYRLAGTYMFESFFSQTGICVPIGIDIMPQGILSTIMKYMMRWFGMMRWVRLGIRYRIILSSVYTQYPFSVPFFGYTYRGDLNDYIDRYAFYFGAYEREELLLLRKYLSDTSIVFDIGANTGHHSLFFSRYAAQVYSFEPYTKMFHLLQERVRHNNIHNIHSFNIGLGEDDVFADFYAPSNNNAGIGSFIPAADKNKIGKLEIRNGDRFLNEHNVSKVDMIKIDVEGMESSVIRGLESTIRRNKPVMFIEANEAFRDLISVEFQDIFSHYTIYIINPNQPYMYIFNRPGCVLESLCATSGVRNILCIPNDNV